MRAPNFSAAEDVIVMMTDLTIVERAFMLGRSVNQIRHRLMMIRKLNLSVPSETIEHTV